MHTAETEMKILAVDDEPSLLDLIPLLAARVGFPQVETAPSGEAALELLAITDPAFDCLIFDINMPDIDGIDLCRLVRRMHSYRQTPIIMLTAMSERHFVDMAFQAGATDYATKPIDLIEFGARLRLVNDLVTARREAAAARTTPAGSPDVETGLDHAIEIGGVPKLADIASLKNYLHRLSLSGATVSQIVAFGIDRIAELHAKATHDEFAYALREVASAISSVMTPSIALMSYWGSGVFVVVSNAAAPLVCEQIESDIQFTLDERNLEFDNGAPMIFEIAMGSAVRPTSGDPDEIERSISCAVARVAARAQHQTSRQSVSIR